ncbi:hypothetical protein PMAYCL1PPCAC_07215 [Pristionchus mayeri]|uniref:Uncharacterized protein n=1 Tax=Pristionchus mayeri TaxID=1317129 RepID=A0AAN4ZHG0_9BILA|nr:hypothetical protein PMAYCL1PPCAC_07215 [Pristionchus mayeri]
MGSRVNVCSVNILDNPSSFADDFKLEITFEAYESLPHDLEWELVYVGSSTDKTYDQKLDSVEVGPTPEGRHKFVFEAASADITKIPVADLIGVTVLLLKVRYNTQEFLNLGWYVKVEYNDPELVENPPSSPILNKLNRRVLTDDLRVTTYPIKWDENQEDEFPPEVENPDEDLIPEDDDERDVSHEEDKEEGEKEKGMISSTGSRVLNVHLQWETGRTERKTLTLKHPMKKWRRMMEKEKRRRKQRPIRLIMERRLLLRLSIPSLTRPMSTDLIYNTLVHSSIW